MAVPFDNNTHIKVSDSAAPRFLDAVDSANLTAKLAVANGTSDPQYWAISGDIPITSPKTIPANVFIERAAKGAKFVASGGTLTFLGQGLTPSEALSQNVLFSGFGEGAVTFTGAEHPREINAEIFDAPTGAVSERWERASKAFTNKFVKIRVNRSGNIASMITIRAKQTLYGEKCNLYDTSPVRNAYVNPALILMESDSTLEGESPQGFRIYEKVLANYTTDGNVDLIRTAGMTMLGGKLFNHPTNNVTVRRVGFYGNKELPGFKDSVSAIALGNGRNLIIDGNYFEGIHTFCAGLGGLTNGDGLPNGTVSTNGTAVTTAALNFPSILAGETVVINHVEYVVASVNSSTSLTLTSSAGVQSNVQMETLFYATDSKIINNTARYAVTQVFYVLTGKRIEIAGNSIFDFGSATTSASALIDIEPNAYEDRAEHINIHDNFIDMSTAKFYATGIAVQTGTSKYTCKFIQVHHNTIVGGYIEAGTIRTKSRTGPETSSNLTVGISANGLEYSAISNNIITLAGQAGISVTNSYKLTVSDNDVYESGIDSTPQSAIRIQNIYQSTVRNNRAEKDTRRDYGTRSIIEVSYSNDFTTTFKVNVAGTTVSRGDGEEAFFHYLKGQVVKINGTDYTVASVTNGQAFELTASAGNLTNAILTFPPNTVTYTQNEAEISKLANSTSTIVRLPRELYTITTPVGNIAATDTLFAFTPIQAATGADSRDSLKNIGDEMVFRAVGSYGVSGSTNKRIRLWEDDIGSGTLLFDSGNSAQSGAGWMMETRVTLTSAGTQKWVSTFTNADGEIVTYFAATSIPLYDGYTLRLSGAGTLANDVVLESYKVTKIQ